MDRAPDSDGRSKRLRREAVDVPHARAAARQDDAGMETVDEILVLERLADHGEDLHQPGVHHGVECAPGDRPVVHQRVLPELDLDAGGCAVRGRDQGAGLLGLQSLGLRVGGLEGVRDVVGDMVAADADHARGDRVAVGVDGVAGRTAAEVDDERAVLLLVVLQDGVRGAGCREERFADLQMRGVRRGAGVLDAVAVRVDVEDVELEDASGHALRGGDAAEVVEDVVLVDDVQELAVLRERQCARAPERLVDLLVPDAGVLDLREAEEGVGLDVLPGDDEEGVADRDLRAGLVLLALDLLEDGADGLRDLVDVEDLALADSRGGDLGVAGHLEPPAVLGLADGEDRPGRADLKCRVDVAHVL